MYPMYPCNISRTRSRQLPVNNVSIDSMLKSQSQVLIQERPVRKTQTILKMDPVGSIRPDSEMKVLYPHSWLVIELQGLDILTGIHC